MNGAQLMHKQQFQVGSLIKFTGGVSTYATHPDYSYFCRFIKHAGLEETEGLTCFWQRFKEDCVGIVTKVFKYKSGRVVYAVFVLNDIKLVFFDDGVEQVSAS